MAKTTELERVSVDPETMYRLLIQRARPDLHIRTWQIWDCLHAFMFWAEQEGKSAEASLWLAQMVEPTDWPVRRHTFWRVLTPDCWKSLEEVQLFNMIKEKSR